MWARFAATGTKQLMTIRMGTRCVTGMNIPDKALTAQNTCRQHEEGANETETTLHRDADQPERQQQQPDEGVKKQEGNG
ncbi:MAG: hypothetical protein JNN04_05570 [Cyclobacteriaceae bacterium]|nr:hypothetical protein [Cyclobacteriaceae bacterium]